MPVGLEENEKCQASPPAPSIPCHAVLGDLTNISVWRVLAVVFPPVPAFPRPVRGVVLSLSSPAAAKPSLGSDGRNPPAIWLCTCSPATLARSACLDHGGHLSLHWDIWCSLVGIVGAGALEFFLWVGGRRGEGERGKTYPGLFPAAWLSLLVPPRGRGGPGALG